LIHLVEFGSGTAFSGRRQQLSEEIAMYDSQSYITDNRAQPGGESCRGIRRRPIKTMETQRELKALICYLRQQEADVLDAMQRLRDTY
jgi:hypothetical protein